MSASLSVPSKIHLSFLMFLQFFIWGAYLVPLGKYLQVLFPENTAITGQAYATNAIAAILSPLFLGWISDKFFSSEKILGVLHLLGGALLLLLSTLSDASQFYVVLLIYSLCYMPTLALSNTVVLNHLSSPESQFPQIRLWGTIGWICAGFIVGSFLPLFSSEQDIGSTSIPIALSGYASLFLGVYSFFLPREPRELSLVSKKGSHLSDLWKVLKSQKSVSSFLISSLLISIPLAFYYGWTNRFLDYKGIMGSESKMALGQVSEIIFMLSLPFFLRKFRVKTILMVGMGAWLLRYGIFSTEGLGYGFLLSAILLHGICYDFFFVTGCLFIDSQVPRKIRSLAQSVLTVATYGVGMLLGNYIAAWAEGRYSLNGELDWASFWQVPTLLVGVVMVIFFFSFQDSKKLN